MPTKNVFSNRQTGQGKWTQEEHELFLTGLAFRPTITWKQIAVIVGTRTPRQTRTHAQKYFEKLERKQRRMEAAFLDVRQPTPIPYYPADKEIVQDVESYLDSISSSLFNN